MAPKLEFEGGVAAPFELREGLRITIGRSPACAIAIADTDISREHAAVEHERGETWIEDLGSKNGTFVNGARTSGRTPLRPDDTFRLGPKLKARLVADPATASTPAAPTPIPQPTPALAPAPSPAPAPAPDPTAANTRKILQAGIFAAALGLFAFAGVVINRNVEESEAAAARDRQARAAAGAEADAQAESDAAARARLERALADASVARPAPPEIELARGPAPPPPAREPTPARPTAPRRASPLPAPLPAAPPTTPSGPAAEPLAPPPAPAPPVAPPGPIEPDLAALVTAARADSKARDELRKTLFVALRHEGALAPARADRALAAVRARLAAGYPALRFVGPEALALLREPALKLKVRSLELRTAYAQDYTRGLGRPIEKVRLPPHPKTIKADLFDVSGDAPKVLESFGAATPGSLKPADDAGLGEDAVWDATLGALEATIAKWNGKL